MSNGQLRDYALVIAPGAQTQIQANGDYFRIIDADGGTVEVSTDAGDKLTVKEGEGAKLSRFEKIRFRNASEVERRVVALVGMGSFESARLTGQVSMLPAGSLVAVGAFAGGDTIPANAERQRLIMVADLANAAAVTLAGLPLQPGDTMDLDVTGAVAVGGGATDTLHVAEVV